MAVERPAADFGGAAVRSLLHVNFKLQQGVLLSIDHPQVHPCGGQAFKTRHRNVGGRIKNLPLELGTGINQSVHVKQSVHQVFTSAQERWPKRIRRPGALAVA